jgi:hypothetical protein
VAGPGTLDGVEGEQAGGGDGGGVESGLIDSMGHVGGSGSGWGGLVSDDRTVGHQDVMMNQDDCRLAPVVGETYPRRSHHDDLTT